MWKLDHKEGWVLKVTQSCLTLCDRMDYIVHGILQARILEWVALPFFRGSSKPRDWTTAGRSPTLQADSLPADPPGKPWVPNDWCFWTVVLKKTLESPLDCKINQSILKEINPEYSLEGLMLKLQYFGHLMWRAASLEKTMPCFWERPKVGWQHQLNGHKFEQAAGDGEGQGSLVCCSPWGCKESDTAEQLNNKNNMHYYIYSW